MNWDSSICRVCLKSEAHNVDLLDNVESKSKCTYLELFNECTRLEARFDDILPKNICKCCSTDLLNSFEFLDRAISSDRFLKNSIIDEKEVDYCPESDVERNDAHDFDDKSIVRVVYEVEESSFVIKTISSFEEGLEIQDQSENYIDSVTNTFEVAHCDDQFSENDQYVDESVQYFDEDAELSVDYMADKSKSQTLNKSQNSAVYGSESVECKICFKVLKRCSLKHHFNRCHKPDKSLLCSSCPKAFTVLSDLRTHMKTHDKERERAFICTICRKGFYEKQALGVHIQRHKGERKFQCEICPKNFTTKKSLEVHEFTHNRQIGRFVCTYCNKRFPSKADLVVHERFHTGDYPYKCELCDKSYAVKSHLNYHLGKHKGITYKCDKCDKEFMNRGSLTSHKYKHLDRMPHECSYCKKGFPSPFKLNRHQNSCRKLTGNDI